MTMDAATQKKHILVVDDDDNTLQSVAFILQADKYAVTTTTNGRTALDLLTDARDASNRIDLLITDVQMPVMNGLALLDELRRRNVTVPVLVITAFGGPALCRDLRERGYSHRLDKPFDDVALTTAIASILGKHGGNTITSQCMEVSHVTDKKRSA